MNKIVAMKSIQPLPQQVVILETFVPKKHEVISLLSQLMNSQGVTVEILTAVWKTDSLEGSWLKLELEGNTQQLFNSMTYLAQLGVIVKIDRDFNLYQLKKTRNQEIQALAEELEPQEEFTFAC